MSRERELAENLKRVVGEIEQACDKVERDPRDVTLIAVTKNFPASDVQRLHELGVSDFAESKVQEFSQKYDELSSIAATWHFVGQVQSNKIREIVRLSDLVHSVDSIRHTEKINQAALEQEKIMNLLIQINLDPDYPNARGGVKPDEAEVLTDLIHRFGHVTLGGIMFIASPHIKVNRAFEEFAAVVDVFRERHPSAAIVSAGMSSDFEEAIAIGATHLRIGSKLLGNRPG